MNRILFSLAKTLRPYSRLMYVSGVLLLMLSASCILSGCMIPAWLQEVEKVGELVGGLVGSIFAVSGKLLNKPGLETVGEALEVGVAAAQAASTGINSAIQAYKSTPNETTLQSVVAAIQAGQSSLAEIEKVENVPAADQAIVSEIIAILTQELQAAESIVPLATNTKVGQTVTVTVPNLAATTKAKVAAAVGKLTP